MSVRRIVISTAFMALASACAPALYKRSGDHPAHIKRQNTPNVIADARGWTFELSEEWNTLNPYWGVCFNGTQQAPVAFDRARMGLSRRHRPRFNYPNNVVGDYNNWDFGPQFTLDGDVGNTNTNLPSMTFEENGREETVYLRSWHTHSPAEHTIDGWTAKAELHYVHYTADGAPRAVITWLIDRRQNARASRFFSQMPPAPDFRLNNTIHDVPCNLNVALQETGGNYDRFFTYRGSLTTPPCYEGLRWFVSTQVLWLNDQQMQELLQVSTFSARPVQPIWQHGVNA